MSHPNAQSSAPLIPLHRTRIKVCGLTREQDVDAAVAAGVDAIGFVLYAPSPRAVSVERAAKLAARSRKVAAPTFSPDGLYFQGPVYDPKWGLPTRTAAYDWLP